MSGAIFLSHPALVEATQNLQYVVIFIFGWLVLKESFKGRVVFGKVLGVVFITVGIFSLTVSEYARELPPVNPSRPIVWGTTFSQYFAEQMGMDWKETYGAIITDLKPKKIRLIAEWDKIESKQNQYDFSDLDWQISEAVKVHSEVLIAVGLKTPRWPECHLPGWALNLPHGEKDVELNKYIQAVAEHYSNNPVVVMWQVENEPFLIFGTCARRTPQELDDEIASIRAIDSRPILLTDGGELGLWKLAAQKGDVFGTTMYRRVYPKVIGSIFGLVDYPITPDFFRLKEKIIRALTGKPDQQYIVIELQGEPWSPKYLNITPIDWQVKNFPPEFFSSVIDYAKQTGFETYYLWGTEWWYWMKVQNGHPEYWEMMKGIMAQSQ
jgi:hypothetical protein